MRHGTWFASCCTAALMLMLPGRCQHPRNPMDERALTGSSKLTAYAVITNTPRRGAV